MLFPLTVKLPAIVKQLFSPVVVIFPSFSNTFSIVTPVADVFSLIVSIDKVPVVDKFSSPKLIAPLLSVIEPSANVRVPIVEPVAADNVELIDAVPVIVALPEAMFLL